MAGFWREESAFFLTIHKQIPRCARDDNSDANVTTSVNLNQRRQALSVHHESGACGHKAYRRQHTSEVPVAAVVREQGNGGDHQSDLEKHLAKVEAIGFVADAFPFCLQGARFTRSEEHTSELQSLR